VKGLELGIAHIPFLHKPNLYSTYDLAI
jgi:hypothetical protein